jgi:hypothetical protein
MPAEASGVDIDANRSRIGARFILNLPRQPA